MEEASLSDKRYAEGNSKGPLDGVPVAIKDNLLVKGIQSSASSAILEGFTSPINATSV